MGFAVDVHLRPAALEPARAGRQLRREPADQLAFPVWQLVQQLQKSDKRGRNRPPPGRSKRRLSSRSRYVAGDCKVALVVARICSRREEVHGAHRLTKLFRRLHAVYAEAAHSGLPLDVVDELQRTRRLRRAEFLAGAASAGATLLAACSSKPAQTVMKSAGAPRILIIGGGLAGASCAYRLWKAGVPVHAVRGQLSVWRTDVDVAQLLRRRTAGRARR